MDYGGSYHDINIPFKSGTFATLDGLPDVSEFEDQVTLVESTVAAIQTDNITLTIYKNSNYATP